MPEAARWVCRRNRADDLCSSVDDIKPQLKEMPGSKSGKFQLASGHVPVGLLGERLLGLSDTSLDRVTN
jgi:hypothetical protein